MNLESVALKTADVLSQQIEIDGVSKSFPRSGIVLHDINLSIERGEIMFLLGASGSGKSTLLRIISGLASPTSGRIIVGGVDVTHTPSRRRGVGFVFQDFALFPHMTVRQNIEFGLRCNRVPKAERPARVHEALRLGHIDGMGDRFPRQLSGGQQQRLAVVRAVACAPNVILFDEPLSSLDAVVRRAIRRQLRELLSSLDVTSVFVSHDFADVLDIGTRVAVLVDGRIVQVGRPADVYSFPESLEVASLTGRFNQLTGIISDARGARRLLSNDGQEICSKVQIGDPHFSDGSEVTAILRPEDVVITPVTSDDRSSGLGGMSGTVTDVSQSGGVIHCEVVLEDGLLIEASGWAASEVVALGSKVSIRARDGRAVLVS